MKWREGEIHVEIDKREGEEVEEEEEEEGGNE
jgi:hypothetical protein